MTIIEPYLTGASEEPSPRTKSRRARARRPTGLHELFELAAARAPETIALVHGTDRVSYGELARRARALACFLARRGIGRGARVGVAVDRSPVLLETLLGVLAAGAAYVPLDPAYPRLRLELMAEDAGVSALLTLSRLHAPLAGCRGEVIDTTAARRALEAAGREIAALPAGRPRRADGRELAYVIYTSGSTGRPKGVAITHGSAAALVRWGLDAFSPSELAGVLASTSICFDLSIFEIFVPLAAGGTVVLADSVLELPALPAASEVTLVSAVPSVLAELVRAQRLPEAVRTVNLAGEPLGAELADRLYRDGAERVLDLYGPSEDTTYSTFAVRRPGGPETVGRPIAGTDVRLLDARGRSLGAGEAGEIHLGGDGLARGYLGRPRTTAESFAPDAWSRRPGARLYRTGDRGRLRSDGDLELLGRADSQVKIRGFRIELREIETVLARFPGIAGIAAAARGPERESRRLAAYYVGAEADGGGAPDPADLRRFAGERLPAHMVPSHFVPLERFPRTPNGKLDRAALPAPRPSRAASSAPWSPPGTAVETTLSAIWRQVLGVASPGVHDNFFHLGGHSLELYQVHSRLRRELDADLELVRLLEYPTIASLAGFLARRRPVVRRGGAPRRRAVARRRAMRVRRRTAPGKPRRARSPLAHA